MTRFPCRYGRLRQRSVPVLRRGRLGTGGSRGRFCRIDLFWSFTTGENVKVGETRDGLQALKRQLTFDWTRPDLSREGVCSLVD